VRHLVSRRTAFHQALSGGAEVLINISSSPYHSGKRRWREHMLARAPATYTVIVAVYNLVGGQDELVFDGDSMVFDENGELIARGKTIRRGIDHHGPRYRFRLSEAACMIPGEDEQTRTVTPPVAREILATSDRVQRHDPVKGASSLHEPLSDEAEIYKALRRRNGTMSGKTVSRKWCSTQRRNRFRPHRMRGRRRAGSHQCRRRNDAVAVFVQRQRFGFGNIGSQSPDRADDDPNHGRLNASKEH